ncbi:MAG: TrkA family potassium uptake protein [Anaerolineales bacterium]|nr:TrkA family potassium uptake protein [Anaerolineales bacterium]
MNVIIVGGGKVGSHLAEILLQGGHTVRVVDGRPEVFRRLQEELPEGTAVFGEMSSPSTLEKAGIGSAGVLAAVTDQDDANLVITTLAKFEFRVPRVISRVNNPKNGWLFTPDMGVDVAISQADMMARLIAEEMSLGDMMTLIKLRKGAFSLVEEKIHPESEAHGKAIRDLGLPKECVLVAIIRKGDLILPHGETVLKESDEVLAVVHRSKLEVLAGKLGKQL